MSLSGPAIPYFNPNLYGTLGNTGYIDLLSFDLGFEEEEEEQELFQFETVLDEKVCPICGPLEGEVYTLDGVEEYFPEAAEGPDAIDANVHDNCRCQLVLTEYSTEEDWTEGILEMY